MTDIAKEIERLANKYRNQEQNKPLPEKLEAGVGFENSKENDYNEDDDFGIDDFLEGNFFDDKDERIEDFERLESDIKNNNNYLEEEGEECMNVSDFINIKPLRQSNSTEDLLEENNQKPKNIALNHIRKISRELRDLKVLIRS